MRRWTLMLAAVLLLLAWSAQADPLVTWDVAPELGAGSTLFHGFQATVALGLKLGTTTDAFPILPNRDFGAAAVQIGDVTGGALWAGLAQVAGVKVRLGGVFWKDETTGKPTGDLLLYGAKDFSFDW
jgi:hypothetical protein